MPFVALNTNRNATNEGSMRKHQTYALVTLSENYLRSLSKLTLLKPYFSIQNFKERSDVWSLKIRQRWKIRKPLVYLDAYEPKLKVRLLKEVIQPQVPLRLPCYDFTPIADLTVGAPLPEGWGHDVGHGQLSWCDGRCVQGPGTYSPRRSDTRLLAIPASCSRVADCNPYYDRFFEIGSTSRLRDSLYRPL